MFAKFFRDCSGATVVEYGLIVALIGAALIGAANFLGNSYSNTYSVLSEKVKSNTHE